MANYTRCNNCGSTIFEGVSFCPKCGSTQNAQMSDSDIQKNPYDILQITPFAEPEVIEASYRSLARKYHPDVVDSSASDERMKEINWAHDILSDPIKRQEWDRKHKGARNQSQNSQSNIKSEPFEWKTDKAGEQPEQSSFRVSNAQQNQPPPKANQVGISTKSNKKSRLPVIIGIVLALSFVSKLSSTLQKSSLSNSNSSGISPSFTLPFPTKTNSADLNSNCLKWNQVTNNHLGKRLCVYGVVVDITKTQDYATRIYFGQGPNDFGMYDEEYIYEDLKPGDCVEAEGIIVSLFWKPALNLHGNLYKCRTY